MSDYVVVSSSDAKVVQRACNGRDHVALVPYILKVNIARGTTDPEY